MSNSPSSRRQSTGELHGYRWHSLQESANIPERAIIVSLRSFCSAQAQSITLGCEGLWLAPDAAAISEAVTRKWMRIVPIKGRCSYHHVHPVALTYLPRPRRMTVHCVVCARLKSPLPGL